MRYIFLAYVDETWWNTLSPGARDALAAECLATDARLRQNGHLLAATVLHGSRTATTVRAHSGKLSVGDGPAAGTQEQLSALFTVEARDLNEAIQVAAQLPQARVGSIEIRPLVESDPR